MTKGLLGETHKQMKLKHYILIAIWLRPWIVYAVSR